MNKTYLIIALVLAGILAALLAVYFWLDRKTAATPAVSLPAPVVSVERQQSAAPTVGAPASEDGFSIETSALENDLADIGALESDVSFNTLEANLGSLVQ